MNRKSKGSIFEREIIHKFWSENWAAFRAAGSGSSCYPCPDIIAGNSIRKMGIEAKVIDGEKKYFSKKEIHDLKDFCYFFGAEAWVVIKFQKKGIFFFSVEDLRETSLGFVITLKDAFLKGFSFKEVLSTNT
jgi:holliday junction resolvase Hjr